MNLHFPLSLINLMHSWVIDNSLRTVSLQSSVGPQHPVQGMFLVSTRINFFTVAMVENKPTLEQSGGHVMQVKNIVLSLDCESAVVHRDEVAWKKKKRKHEQKWQGQSQVPFSVIRCQYSSMQLLTGFFPSFKSPLP